MRFFFFFYFLKILENRKTREEFGVYRSNHRSSDLISPKIYLAIALQLNKESTVVIIKKLSDFSNVLEQFVFLELLLFFQTLHACYAITRENTFLNCFQIVNVVNSRSEKAAKLRIHGKEMRRYYPNKKIWFQYTFF